MTPKNLLQAFRTPRRIALLAATALVALAAPASALLGLPVALPGVDQDVSTPAGTIDASASEDGASTCADLATPSLPALPSAPSLPSLPVPLPVAVPSVPAVPTPSAAAGACASAGLNGASASLDADAAGSHIGTGIDAQSPVPVSGVEGIASEAQGIASQTSGESVGFFEGLMDKLFSWI